MSQHRIVPAGAAGHRLRQSASDAQVLAQTGGDGPGHVGSPQTPHVAAAVSQQFVEPDGAVGQRVWHSLSAVQGLAHVGAAGPGHVDEGDVKHNAVTLSQQFGKVEPDGGH